MQGSVAVFVGVMEAVVGAVQQNLWTGHTHTHTQNNSRKKKSAFVNTSNTTGNPTHTKGPDATLLGRHHQRRATQLVHGVNWSVMGKEQLDAVYVTREGRRMERCPEGRKRKSPLKFHSN